MASYVANLQAAREQLASVLATNAGRPNFNIDGESMDFGELLDRIAKLDAAIAAAQGPVVSESQGVV